MLIQILILFVYDESLKMNIIYLIYLMFLLSYNIALILQVSHKYYPLLLKMPFFMFYQLSYFNLFLNFVNFEQYVKIFFMDLSYKVTIIYVFSYLMLQKRIEFDNVEYFIKLILMHF